MLPHLRFLNVVEQGQCASRMYHGLSSDLWYLPGLTAYGRVLFSEADYTEQGVAVPTLMWY